jgi:hypothetical protein
VEVELVADRQVDRGGVARGDPLIVGDGPGDLDRIGGDQRRAVSSTPPGECLMARRWVSVTSPVESTATVNATSVVCAER